MYSSLNYIFKELKIRFVWIFVTFLLTFFVCYHYSEYLLFLLIKPFLEISGPNSLFLCTKLTESFNTYCIISFFITLFLFIPYFCYQMCCFLIPSIYKYQRAIFLQMVKASGFFFIIVFLLTFYWIMPFFWYFFYKLSTNTIQTNLLMIQLQLKIYDFIFFTFRFLIISTICSQIPVFIFYFFKFKLIKIVNVIQFRKVFIFFSILLSALLSPPDVVLQLSIGLFIYFLIELSILLSFVQFNYVMLFSKKRNEIVDNIK
uniref:SecY-independent transporter protein n=1 Tax=Roya anglica TaxID=43943 RepID=A0A6G9IES5_9VIRI|nr:SecY-independent transporter protein [Roya anglica]QIQ22962.1 SecY-independent transporter protein [Roya anglica]